MTAGGREESEPPYERVPHGRLLAIGSGQTAFTRVAGRARRESPVLLLHGLGATGALNWATCFEPLTRRTQVIAVDHRGHGRGSRIGNRFRLADCADDAAAVLKALGTGPAIVVGYSMGGPIAQLMALRHPDAVAGLVLSATSRDFRGHPRDRLRFAAVGIAAAAAPFGPRSFGPAVPVLPGALRHVSWTLAELRRHEPAAILSAAAALGRFTSREWIGRIAAPTTVIVHTRDKVVPTNRQYKLAAALADTHTVEVDLDHIGIVRQPDLYLPALLEAHRSVATRVEALAA